jgi:hypothetical protein
VSEVGLSQRRPAGPARPRRVPPAPRDDEPPAIPEGRPPVRLRAPAGVGCSSSSCQGSTATQAPTAGRDDRDRRRSIVVGRIGQGLEARFIEIGTGFAYAAALRVPKPRGLSTSPHLHFTPILYGRLALIAIWRADHNWGLGPFLTGNTTRLQSTESTLQATIGHVLSRISPRCRPPCADEPPCLLLAVKRRAWFVRGGIAGRHARCWAA